jgi:hypothetical protein
MPYAQAFQVYADSYMTRIVIRNGEREFLYDPPVHLHVGTKYGFDVEDGTLWELIGEGGYMERVGKASVTVDDT